MQLLGVAVPIVLGMLSKVIAGTVSKIFLLLNPPVIFISGPHVSFGLSSALFNANSAHGAIGLPAWVPLNSSAKRKAM